MESESGVKMEKNRENLYKMESNSGMKVQENREK